MLKYRFLLIAMIFVSAFLLSKMSFAASDEPDIKKEQRFHDIYEEFNSTPTSPEAWSGVVQGKTQTYSIQQGDTLWDLSATLFGDSQFWPKIWSINSDKIENPHEIHPGLDVHFTPGTAGEAPSLALKPTENKEAEVESGEQQPPAEKARQKEMLGMSQIPPEPPAVKPTALPQSVPSWSFRKPENKLIFEVHKMNRDFEPPEEPLSTFVAKDQVQGVGTIAETELNTKTASEFQYVYVKLNNGAAGKTYYAVSNSGTVKDPQSGDKAQLVQVQGELEVLEKVNSGDNVYRALVKKVINPVEVGAELIEGSMPRFNSNPEGEGQAKAHVIGGQFSTKRTLFAKPAIIFLAGEGLSVGQSYPIFKKQSLRNAKTEAIENPRQIGRIKILKADDGFATALVLQSLEEIQVGDMTNPQATE